MDVESELGKGSVFKFAINALSAGHVVEPGDINLHVDFTRDAYDAETESDPRDEIHHQSKVRANDAKTVKAKQKIEQKRRLKSKAKEAKDVTEDNSHRKLLGNEYQELEEESKAIESPAKPRGNSLDLIPINLTQPKRKGLVELITDEDMFYLDNDIESAGHVKDSGVEPQVQAKHS